MPQRAQTWRRMALMGALALLLLLRGPALMSTMWGNAVMLMLHDEFVPQADFAPGTYPVYEVSSEALTTACAMQSLRRAAELEECSLSARWALGRAALAVGDVETAADALGPLTGRVRGNPLLYYDAMIALSYGGQPGDVIALYESAPPLQSTQTISNAVALAYLERIQVTGMQGGEEAIARAAELRSGNLYVNYCLWRAAMADRDVEAAAVYGQKLSYFPLEAMHPADERLLDYVADAIPDLLKEGLWDRSKTLNVVSFLVWQHNSAVGVERLLEQLIERYPTDPDWFFYLAELYHRRGDLERAEAAYQQALALDQNYAPAYLRIGMLYEARAEEEMEE